MGIIKSVRTLLPLLVCLALTGCHSNMQNEDAVKRGVMDYLSTRQGLNISSMDVSVASMVFRENEVEAARGGRAESAWRHGRQSARRHGYAAKRRSGGRVAARTSGGAPSG